MFVTMISYFSGTLIENPKETKQVKLINAETQTNVKVEKDEISKENGESMEKPQDFVEENDIDLTKKRESPLRVFDDAPLERIRKNRLAALMGSLSGKDPVLAPKPTFSSILNGNIENSDSQTIDTSANELDKSEKPLVSILTTNKLLHKSDKHVHFNIPEISSSISSSDSKTSNNTINSSSNKNMLESISLNQASNNLKDELSVIAPPSSPVSLKPPESNEKIDKGSKSCSVLSLPSIQEASVEAKSSTSSVINPFINLSSSTGSTNTQFAFSTSNTIVPSVNFAPAVNSPTSSLNATSLATDAKMGGFKFDLSTSKIDFSKNTTTNTNNTAMSSLLPTVALMPFGKLDSTMNSVGSTIVTTINTASTLLTFGTTTTASSSGPLSSSSTSPFKFGVFTSDSQTKAKSTTLGIKTSAAGSTFALGGNSTAITTTKTITSAITTSSLTTQENKTPTFSFNAHKISSTTTNVPAPTPSFSFGNQKETPITASFPTTTINFGATVSNSLVISKNMGITNANGFGITTSSSGLGGSTHSIGIGSSTASSGFGALDPSTGFGSSTRSFGTLNTSNVNNSISQSSTNASSSFGASTTAVNVFGTAVITTASTIEPSMASGKFKAPATRDFGPKTSSTAPSFTAATNNSIEFGGFGASNKPTARGFATTDVSSTGGFGSTSTPIFGVAVTTTSSFGNSAAMASSPFSNASIPTFGQKGPSASFGTSTTTTTASFGSASNTFNNTTTTSSSVFGGTSGFGGTLNSPTNIFEATSTTQTPGFGTSNTIFATTSTISPFENKATTTNSTAIFSFGAKTTTASGNGFGASPSSTGGFGALTVPSFGTNNTFGGNSNNNFGNTNAFGSSNTPTTTQSSGFATQSTTFGAPGNQGFGIENKSSPNQGFGMENKPVFGNSAPSFGTSSAATVTVFGTNSAPAFGASNSNTPSFAASNTNSGFGKPQGTTFGATVPNNFNSTTGGFGPNQSQGPFGNSNAAASSSNPVFNFGSGATSKPGVFSFGGPSSGELPKPAFNFTSGNGAPVPAPAFGAGTSFAGTTSSFGNSGPPQFGAPPAAPSNMFNIGSGSPSTRNRTMIRAKRRT